MERTGRMTLPNGTYRTAAGSTLKISGKHGGIVEVDFDWLEEPDACLDCSPSPYPDEDFLTWQCDYCGGGSAQLFPVES
jgi:hypothetical protein